MRSNADHGKNRLRNNTPNRIVERLNKELKLTEKQQSELKTWFSESFKQRENPSPKTGITGKPYGNKWKRTRSHEDGIEKVLTAEQYKIYQTNEEKREKERAQRGPGHPGIPPHGNYPATNFKTAHFWAVFLCNAINYLYPGNNWILMVLFLLTYYAVLSFLTFLLFGVDKWKARNHQWRIPETRLYLLSVLGRGSRGLYRYVSFPA